MYLNGKGDDLDNGCPTLQGQVGKRQPQSTTVLTLKGSNHEESAILPLKGGL